MKTKLKCPNCGNKFIKKGNNQKFCSRKCSCAYWRKNNKNHISRLNKKWKEKNPEYYKKYLKKWSKNNPKKEYEKVKQYRKTHPRKSKAHNYANNNLRKQILKERKNCEKCGSNKNLELHHKKYTNKKEDILLLCNTCHKKIHYGGN